VDKQPGKVAGHPITVARDIFNLQRYAIAEKRSGGFLAGEEKI
jgi:hypothetical protein